jgi:hypothetical protein
MNCNLPEEWNWFNWILGFNDCIGCGNFDENGKSDDFSVHLNEPRGLALGICKVFPRKKCFPCDDTNLFILLCSSCPFVFGERERAFGGQKRTRFKQCFK